MDVETNPGPRWPVPTVFRQPVVMCGAWLGTLVPWRRLSMTHTVVLRDFGL